MKSSDIQKLHYVKDSVNNYKYYSELGHTKLGNPNMFIDLSTKNLSEIEATKSVNLLKISANFLDSIVLAEMGIIGAIPIHVIRNTGAGPLLISVRDTRIIIGRDLALKIFVELVE